MANRRVFVQSLLAGTAGVYAMRGDVAAWQASSRRQVTIGGRRVRVIDGHAHCVIPVQHITKGTPLEKLGGGAGEQRLHEYSPIGHRDS